MTGLLAQARTSAAQIIEERACEPPADDALELAWKLQTLGRPFELSIFKGDGHGVPLPTSSKWINT